MEALQNLQQEGVLAVAYVHDQTVVTEKLRAGTNFLILQRRDARETEDRQHFTQMRATNELRLKSS